MSRWTTGSDVDLILSFGGVDVSSNVKSVDTGQTQDLIEASAANDAYKLHLKGRSDAKFSIEAFWNTTSPSPGSVFYAGVSGTIIFQPRGTATGEPKWDGVLIVESVSSTFNRESAAMKKIDLKLVGAWTKDGDAGGVN